MTGKNWSKKIIELIESLPFDAMHKYDPMSVRDNLVNFRTSPLNDVTNHREMMKERERENRKSRLMDYIICHLLSCFVPELSFKMISLPSSRRHVTFLGCKNVRKMRENQK